MNCLNVLLHFDIEISRMILLLSKILIFYAYPVTFVTKVILFYLTGFNIKTLEIFDNVYTTNFVKNMIFKAKK